MKKYIYYLFLSFVVLSMIGCGKKKENNGDNVIRDYVADKVEVTPKPTEVVEPVVTPIEEDTIHEGEMRSMLTGLWVSEEIGKKRPFAIQFNNFKSVSNQSGIGQSDILYEALVEGGITRLLAIGQNFSGDRFGSVRSARHYFVSIADEYDSIYIHYGRTKYAVSKLKELEIEDLEGMSGIGTTLFYRDESIKAPNNAFTSIDRILESIQIKGYETAYAEDYEAHFSFYEEDTQLSEGTDVNKVTTKFSAYTKPYFEYHEEDKLYYRYQFGAIHKDSVTGNQLSFKNVIIQFVNEWDIDKNDYQTMDFEDASGSGYYISNGNMVPITWKKKEASSWMRYYNDEGEELTINPGKTFVAIFPDDRTKDVVIE